MPDTTPAPDAWDRADGTASLAPPRLAPPETAAAARWDLADGTYSAPGVPAEDRAAAFTRAHALAGTDPGKFREQAEAHFPGAGAQLEPAFKLESAKARAATMEEPDTLKVLEAIPGAGAVGGYLLSREYGKARERVAQGKAVAKGEGGQAYDDYDLVAQYERLQNIRQNESTEQSIYRGLRHVPAVVGEAAAGGAIARGAGAALGLGAGEGASLGARLGTFAGRQAAVTPLMPALYAEKAAQKNLAEGRPADDWRGFPPALGLAYANNLVLGQMQQKFGFAPGGLAGRAAAKGAVGVGEQAGVDALAGAVDELLPKAWRTDTRYGTIGDLVRGDTDAAAKHAIVQFVTFAAVAAAHDTGPPKAADPGTALATVPPGPGLPPAGSAPPGTPRIGPEAPHPVIQKFADALNWMKGEGWSDGQRDAAITAVRNRFDAALRADPDLTREQAAGLFPGMKEGPVRDFVMELANVFRPAAERTAGPTVRQPGPAGELPAPQVSGEAAPAPREPFRSQADLDAAELQKQGFTPAQVATLKARGLFHPPDVVTGFDLGTHRVATVERAKEHVARTGEPAVYVEADIVNLGGLNAHFGANAKANPTVRAMTDIFRGELQKAGGDVQFFRHGGDEVSAVVVGADRAAVGEALARAEARVQDHLRAAGLDAIPHPKSKPEAPRPPGAGLAFGTAEIRPGRPAHDIFVEADSRIAAGRKGANGVNGIAAGAAGLEPPGGQAGGVAEGTGPAGGGVRPAGEAGGPAAPAGPAGDRGPPAAKTGRLTALDVLSPAQLTRFATQMGIDPASPPEAVVARVEAAAAASPKVRMLWRSLQATAATKAGVVVGEPGASMGGVKRQKPEATEGDPTEGGPPGPSLDAALRGRIDAAQTLKPAERAALLDYLDRPTREAAEGAGVSNQTVLNRANRAVEKLATEFPAEFGTFKTAEGLRAGLAEQNARAANEAATKIAGGELHPDDVKQLGKNPDVVRAAKKKLTDLERAQRDLDKLLAKWIKEHDRGITPERDAEFRAKADQLAGRLAELEPAQPGQDRPAQGVPGGQPGPGRAGGPKPAAPRPAPRQDKSEYTVNVVKWLGGIDPKSHAFLAHYGSMREAIQDGVPLAAFKRGGNGLDALAKEMHVRGELPDGDTHTLLDMLRRNAPTAAADTTASVARRAADRDARLQEEDAARLADLTPEGRAAELDRRQRETDELAERPLDADFESHLDADFDPAKLETETRRFGGGAGLRGREGALHLPAFKGSNAEAAIRAAHDEYAKLRGEQFPATAREAEPVADRMAALVSAKAYAEAVTGHVLGAVFGPLKPEVWAKFYTAHLESRLAYMRSKGANAISLIGPDSPLKTFAEYVAVLRDPEFRKYLDRWKAVEVPIMDKHFRDAQGLAPGTPIHTETQLPGYPINLVRVRQDGSTSAVGGGGARLRPEAVHQKRLGFNKKASGESPFGYETDPRKALLTAHEQGAAAAGRANLDREIVATGQGQWGQPGKAVPAMPDGTPMVPVRDVTPEHGTQVATPRQTTLYLNPKVRDDYHNAIDLGYTFHVPVLTPVLQAATKVAIASTVEAAYHSFNLIQGVGRPYVLRNLAREVWDFARPLLKRELPHLSGPQLERFAGLAEGGMTKEHGFQAGFLVPEGLAEKYPVLGKLDPTRWASAFLDTVDKLMRLAMDGAFRKMAREGLVADTPRNKRDFLNTLGNYKRQSQAVIVRILRGTGFGPFATAATNSPVQAVRSLWLSPGVTARSPALQARLRLHMFLKLAAAVGLGQLVNWLGWGRPDGDDATPFGAVKVGEANGRTQYVDPLRLLGPRRGLHVLGLDAVIQGQRVGASPKATFHAATEDVTHAFLHPAVGPGVQFGYTAKTGKSTLGSNLAGKPDDGVPQEWENLKAALKNANPSLAALMLADRVKEGEKMPFFPLFGREVPGSPGGLVGQYPEKRPFGAAAGKLLAPYVGSRAQLSVEVQRGFMEKEAKKR